MLRSPFLWLVPFLASCAGAFAETLPATAEHAAQMTKGLELFNSEVGGLLAEHCVSCHGGEKGTKGDLDMSTREALLRGGGEGPSIVVGKSAESYLMTLIRHEDDPHMPKKAAKLPDEAIAKIAAWIDAGAPYAKPLVEGKGAGRDKSKVGESDRKFWSFQPLASAEPPTVSNTAWCRTPIDRFILAKLEEKGIQPSEPAERRSLARRAYFDLIGLPPTAEQMERFVHDSSPDPYEKLVDELLASPHYGERWGRHWLDLARFAESHGYEQDYDRKFAYPYRDFVIRSLNSDLPYDKFVQWQIAGDELAAENPDAWFATGFLAAGTHATQITANQAEKERYDELDDQVATLGTAMLGLTVGCARCHDHKFDPIPTADYYRLLSTFTTAVRSDYDVPVSSKEFSDKHAAWERAHTPLTDALQRYEREILPGLLDAWLGTATAVPEPDWITPHPGGLSVTGPYYSITQQQDKEDGSYLVTVTAGTPDTYIIRTKATLAAPLRAIRLEAMIDKALPGYGPGWSGTGGFLMQGFDVKVRTESGETACKFVDEKRSWNVAAATGKDVRRVFRLAEPLAVSGPMELTITMKFDGNFDRRNIGRFRLALSTKSNVEDESSAPVPMRSVLMAQAALSKDSRNAEQIGVLSEVFRASDPEWKRLAAAVQEHAQEEPRPEIVKALVCSEGLPAVRLHTQGPDFYDKTFLLKRGDLNQKQSEASQGFLQVLMRSPEQEGHWIKPPPAGTRTPFRRAALAQWITDPDAGAGHLLARVIVNRLWQHHLGRGIVATPSDFGAQGDRPTHPELLDWLASELIRNGWHLKPIHKLIMLSSVYLESGKGDEAQRTKDPNNVLYWHHPRQRLEGEVIRDAILAVTGALDRKMFGPGSLDASMKRRSIYFTIKRSQLPPMMVTFDAPDSLQSLGLRSSTTVPPQALLLMNNDLVRSSAKRWAETLAPAAAQTGQDAIQQVYLSALGRSPNEQEVNASIAFLRSQAGSYANAGRGEPDELAWTDFVQAILSSNEFVYTE